MGEWLRSRGRALFGTLNPYIFLENIMPMTFSEASTRFYSALNTGNGRAAKRYLRRILRISRAHVDSGRLNLALTKTQRYANRATQA